MFPTNPSPIITIFIREEEEEVVVRTIIINLQQ
jgi:hypothetical protein